MPGPKFLIKQYPPSDYCLGLMAIVFQVLGILKLMKNENTEVLVDARGTTPYYDKDRGGNAWEYFFSQPSNYNLEEALGAHKEDCTIGDFQNCYYLFGLKNGGLNWPAEHFKIANELFSNHIKVNPAILSGVEAFYNAKIKGRKTLGAQYRGTDLYTTGHLAGGKIPPERHLEMVKKLLPEFDQAYLITDEAAVVRLFKKELGNKLIHYDDALLSEDTRGLHWIPGNGYKKGCDVITEMLLLSKTDYLIAMSSNVSAMARTVNPLLPCEYIDAANYYI